MNYEKILWKVLETFQKCNVKSFPINCYDLLKQYGYECMEYSELEEEKQTACYQVSDDAFRLNHTVYYNDSIKGYRKRFSLMHELGHIVLNHKAPYTDQHEREANFYASNILAPRMAINYSKCKNASDVARIFRMTYESASYAFDDFRRWRRKAVYRMCAYDKAVYNHFYDSNQECFVWNIHRCKHCNAEIRNSLEEYCNPCKVYTPPVHIHVPLYRPTSQDYKPVERSFIKAEVYRLFGSTH